MKSRSTHKEIADAGATEAMPTANSVFAKAPRKASKTRRSYVIPHRGASGPSFRMRRATAREGLSRAKAREELFGETFDFFSAKDCLRVLLCVGGLESVAAGGAGYVLTPYPIFKEASALVLMVSTSILALGQVGAAMSLWAVVRFLFCFRRRALRPIYYPEERKRRERLAAKRRKVRARFTTGPCPTPEQLLEQYAKVRGSAREALRFGSLLCDLEAYCDNSLVRDEDGEIRGRNPGVRGWLRVNCPELAAHYARAMHYKALAEKFRQAVGAEDPIPAAWLAEDGGESVKNFLNGDGSRKLAVRITKANGDRKGFRLSRTFVVDGNSLETAWQKAQGILSEAIARTRCGTIIASKAETSKKDGEGRARTRCGTKIGGDSSTTSQGKGKAKAAETRGKAETRIRYGMVARLEEVLEERLAPEFAPSGWKMSETAPPRASFA